MAHESLEQQPPFAEIVIPEAGLGWMNEAERYQDIIKKLQEAEVYHPSSLYCGIDGEVVARSGTFGDRRKTWAVDEAGFRRGAEDRDRYGDNVGIEHNPLSYAFTSGMNPALVVYDKEAFKHPADDDSYSDNIWELKDGYRMDEAVRCVIYFS